MPFAPLFLALGLALAQTAAWSADMTEPAPPEPAVQDPLAVARAYVQARRWPEAITALKQVNATADADWNNLMGYTLRKKTPPDLDGAQRHYDTALKINPRHQGALEYAGELALMKGNLATAEAHLATLGRLCRSPCEALDDLKKAVDAYKAGKR
jgi:tetratricopeptide (TPR) repeat protein